MHRVDTEGHDAGAWRDGTPQIGQQGTIMSADWLNDVQENICTVIEDAGVVLAKGDPDQLKLAIAAMIAGASNAAITASRTPVGTVIRLDGPNAPTGYLKLDGSQHLRAAYPDLVLFYAAQDRLITGDTIAHFKVPDYRGLFDRAWSSDSAVDPAGPRAPGSTQADDLKSHSHSLPTRDNANAGDSYAEDADGTGTARTAATGATGGLETRPKNVAFLWCIKT